MSETRVIFMVRVAFVMAMSGLCGVFLCAIWQWPTWAWQAAGTSGVVGYIGGLAVWLFGGAKRW